MPVTRLEITSQEPFADGQSFGEVGSYTQIDGTAHFAVDPLHPANETIADIKLAPRNADGLVEFSADFRILRPDDPGKGNRRLLLDVLNRGKALALRNINSAPDVAARRSAGSRQRLPDAPGLHPSLVRLAARRSRYAGAAANTFAGGNGGWQACVGQNSRHFPAQRRCRVAVPFRPDAPRLPFRPSGVLGIGDDSAGR